MPSIPDRIGGQNVIRVLSNSTSSPTRFRDLTDVNSSNLIDGYIIVYDSSTDKFIIQNSLEFANVNGNLYVVGITTLAASGGITTTGGDFYVGGDLYVSDDINFDELNARNANITGITTLGNLKFSGTSIESRSSSVVTVNDNLSVVGFITSSQGVYYLNNFDGPNGVAFFDNNGKLVSSASTESSISTTTYILTIDNNVPVWSSSIDGGTY